MVHEFLRNNRDSNYPTLVKELLEKYYALSYNMLKTHTLYSHLFIILENYGPVTGEHREKFHPDITSMKQEHQGQWNKSMLADYC